MTTTIIKTYPTLFKTDLKKHTRVWSLRVLINTHTKNAHIVADHGVQGGEITTSEKIIESGKNIGKKNETTPQEQAIRIADKMFIDKKNKELMTESITDETTTVHKPMLANVITTEELSKLKFPLFVQPKLDGVRCLAYRVAENIVYQSRNFTFYNNFEFMTPALRKIFISHPTLVLDGEMYCHGEAFSDYIGYIKKTKVTATDKAFIEKNIKYHVYDCFDTQQPNMPFSQRQTMLRTLDLAEIVEFVRTTTINNINDLKRINTDMLQDGYEGIMIRDGNAKYENKRTNALYKLKPFFDCEFKIIGFKDGVGRDKGAVIWVCETKTGDTFDVRPNGTIESRQHAFKNAKAQIGKLLTVKYQELNEDTHVPRFPVGIQIRDYE